MAKKQSFFEKRSVAATFGILALLGGIFFVKPFLSKNATGNVIGDSSFNLIPLIGLLLLICSIVLIAYSIVKKE
ncbi:hypothetical protein HY212_02470 [Candidatus Pacearchaeota archaeon]|nr:hypothetical protein [Candidatus Pacearchaeota archaeon]